MLREPFFSAGRADVVVLNRKFYEREEIPGKFKAHFNKKITFSAYYDAIGFVDVKKHILYKAEEFIGQKSLVVCGIANPKSFLNALTVMKIMTTNKLIFRDHKYYKSDHIQKIRKQFYDTNAHSVITTQKDAVKLGQYAKELDDIDIYYLKIEMKFDEQEKFNQFIINKINEPN
jgi:tetraacyldisaccharide 4'-kinase